MLRVLERSIIRSSPSSAPDAVACSPAASSRASGAPHAARPCVALERRRARREVAR